MQSTLWFIGNPSPYRGWATSSHIWRAGFYLDRWSIGLPPSHIGARRAAPHKRGRNCPIYKQLWLKQEALMWVGNFNYYPFDNKRSPDFKTTSRGCSLFVYYYFASLVGASSSEASFSCGASSEVSSFTSSTGASSSTAGSSN